MQANSKGFLYALVATALFSVTAVMAKIAAADYHVLQILFFRQLVVFLSSLPTLIKTYPESLKTRHVALHAWRLMGAFIALSFSIWAITVLPLTTAVTLSFAQTFFVAVLASVILKETVGKHRILAIIAGFAGVVIVMRPGLGGFVDINTFIPLFGALGAAVAVVSVRKLTRTESTTTLLLYQSVFVGLLAGLPLFWFWVTPNPGDLIFLLAMGVVAAAGQWIGIAALRLGEASVISTIKYTDLLFVAVLGFALFGEFPEKSTILGAAIIILSALYLFQRENRAKS